ncbi:MAG: hypothetical protein K2F79_05970, partial [Muribaculaceae bacterium]|nr:hypothetical protein [Muribaculaceae bacterium]
SPAKAPAPAPQSHAPAYVPGGMSLSGRLRATQAPAPATSAPQAPAAPPVPRMSAYSEADFDTAWRKCTGAFTSEPVLRSALSVARPEHANGHTYVLTVTNNMQVDALEKELSSITAMMRDLLRNDAVNFTVRLSQAELPPQFWTEKQVLDHMVAHHPAIVEMMAKYKMRLT